MALAAVAGCNRPSVEQIETTAVVPVAVEIAKTDAIETTIAATGLVTPAPGAELTIIAPEAARIVELPKSEGDRVKRRRSAGPLRHSDAGGRLWAPARRRSTQVAARASRTARRTSRASPSLLEHGVAAPRDVEDAKRDQAEAEADARAGTKRASRLQARWPSARSCARPSPAWSRSAATIRAISSRRRRAIRCCGDQPVAAAGRRLGVRPRLCRASPVGRRRVRSSGRARRQAEAATVLTNAPRRSIRQLDGRLRLAFNEADAARRRHPRSAWRSSASERTAALVDSGRRARSPTRRDSFVMVAGDDNKAHKQPVPPACRRATHDGNHQRHQGGRPRSSSEGRAACPTAPRSRRVEMNPARVARRQSPRHPPR